MERVTHPRGQKGGGGVLSAVQRIGILLTRQTQGGPSRPTERLVGRAHFWRPEHWLDGEEKGKLRSRVSERALV